MADRVGQQLGHYRLLRNIGQGSFADVYLGEHQYLERPAAIKVLRVQMDPQAQEQFRREARTIAHLQHPHIVQVLDFGLDDHTPYLVMEYIPGGTLRSHHPRGTRLPFEQIVTYVKQIASALDYAHQQRVIHHDVKPENLLLNAHHEVVLTDFGVAVVQRTLDSLFPHNPAGTPLYMAPEQIQHQLCVASDQYALGILVYEWLVGEAPFGGRLFEVFGHHLYQPPPSLRQRLPDLPVALEEAVFKALAKNPEHRFACVVDFATALEQACSASRLLTFQEVPFVPAAVAKELEAPSFSTQAMLRTAQRTEREEEGVPVRAPGPSLYGLMVPRQIKPSISQSNRQRFLRRVHAFWIDGVLSHSLHGASLIALGLQEQPDALANPWQLVLQQPDTALRSFPLGTRITEVYDAANGELLLLGAPGSGKTTLLLELARDLLDRAQQDEQHLMPVVFPLSSWAAKQQPLAEWMIEELINKYNVPRKLARTWIETDLILPLLDGLDEVATEHRTKCIETINTYHQEHAFLSLVVSSRSADYLSQSGRVRLMSAVTIQSLTQQQVDDYLAYGGEALRALHVAFHQDRTMREFTETPLMLSILTLTFHDMPVEELLRAGIAPTRQQVFEHYTERMLTRRRMSARYTPEQTIHWLAWLAQQMLQHNQTMFYLEQLQPDWLAGRRWSWVYDSLAVLLPGMLIGVLVDLFVNAMLFAFTPPTIGDIFFCILVGALMGGLFSGSQRERLSMERGAPSWRSRWRHLIPVGPLSIGLLIALGIGLSYRLQVGQDHLNTWFYYGLINGLTFGLSSALLCVIFEKRKTTRLRTETNGGTRDSTWHHLVKAGHLGNGLLAGGIIGLSYALHDYWLDNGWDGVLGSGIPDLLACVLIGVILSVILAGGNRAIRPTEIITWSWRSLRHSLFNIRPLSNGLLAGGIIGLSFGLSFGLQDALRSTGPSRLITVLVSVGGYTLSSAVTYWPIYWLFVGFSQGVSGNTLTEQHRVIPNQGIRRSTRNSILLGLIGALVTLFVYFLSNILYIVTGGSGNTDSPNWLLQVMSDSQIYRILVVLSGGLLIGMLNGGLACIRHGVLRLLLWRTGAIPWNYPRFLDFAAERLFLRKVGGGYIFVHHLLLEYFASLDTTPTPDAARKRNSDPHPKF